MPTMHRCIASSKPKCIENRIWSHLAALNLKYHRISCTTTIRLNLNSINIKVSFYIKFLSANKSFLVALFAARDFRNCHRRTTSKSSFNSLSAHCSSLTDSVSSIATTEYLVFSTNSIPVFFFTLKIEIKKVCIVVAVDIVGCFIIPCFALFDAFGVKTIGEWWWQAIVRRKKDARI